MTLGATFLDGLATVGEHHVYVYFSFPDDNTC